MRKVALILLLGALVWPLEPARTQQAQPNPQPPARDQEPPTIRRRVDLVNLVLTVLNRRQKFVTDLEKASFKVFEDGRPQEIQFFGRETDLPLRIGLLLDTSNSIRSRLSFEQNAAIDFLHGVVRRQKDQAFLMTFDNEPTVVQDYTDDVGLLQEVILRQRAGGGTAIYAAVHYACKERLLNPPAPRGDDPEVRRVLLVISDGVDTDPAGPSRSEAIEMCQRADTAIYTISTSTDWLSFSGTTPKKFHKTEGDDVLEQFSNETGGRAFFPYKVEDLSQSFQDIGEELRSQYSIGYVPENRAFDGKFRRIKVEVDRRGLTVRTRKGYYAPRPPAESSRPASDSPRP